MLFFILFVFIFYLYQKRLETYKTYPTQKGGFRFEFELYTKPKPITSTLNNNGFCFFE